VKLLVSFAFSVLILTVSNPALSGTDSRELTTAEGLVPHGVTIEPVRYQGFDAVKVQVSAEHKAPNQGGCGSCTFAAVSDIDFGDGVIEVEVAGRPVEGAPPWARGFVGIVFRVSGDASHYEGVYLRPENAVSQDQLQRNHTVQYFAYPDYQWQRLREESPGQYESYAPVVPGAWTHLRLEVSGATARLYIGDEDQPALVVNDLKLGAGARGSIGLFTEPAQEAYFRKLVVTHAD